MKIAIIFACVLSSAVTEHLLSGSEVQLDMKYNNDFGMPVVRRTKRQADDVAAESAIRMGATTGRLMAGVARIARNFPQFVVDGRHFLPSDYSLTAQIGLQGINHFVGEVVNYEKTQAMAIAREASCRQKENCRWNQRFATFGNLFGVLSEEQKLVQNVNCDSIFAGCEHYH